MIARARDFADGVWETREDKRSEAKCVREENWKSIGWGGGDVSAVRIWIEARGGCESVISLVSWGDDRRTRDGPGELWFIPFRTASRTSSLLTNVYDELSILGNIIPVENTLYLEHRRSSSPQLQGLHRPSL
jgi:hypothetical protein